MMKTMLPTMMGIGATWRGDCPKRWKTQMRTAPKDGYSTTTARIDRPMDGCEGGLSWCLTIKLTGARSLTHGREEARKRVSD